MAAMSGLEVTRLACDVARDCGGGEGQAELSDDGLL